MRAKYEPSTYSCCNRLNEGELALRDESQPPLVKRRSDRRAGPGYQAANLFQGRICVQDKVAPLFRTLWSLTLVVYLLQAVDDLFHVLHPALVQVDYFGKRLFRRDGTADKWLLLRDDCKPLFLQLLYSLVDLCPGKVGIVCYLACRERTFAYHCKVSPRFIF